MMTQTNDIPPMDLLAARNLLAVLVHAKHIAQNTTLTVDGSMIWATYMKQDKSKIVPPKLIWFNFITATTDTEKVKFIIELAKYYNDTPSGRAIEKKELQPLEEQIASTALVIAKESGDPTLQMQCQEAFLDRSSRLYRDSPDRRKLIEKYPHITPYVPYTTMTEMLEHVSPPPPIENTPAEDMDPEQRNAQRNRFDYEKRESDQQQTIVIKRFNANSYTGPTQHDFVERLNIIYESAVKMIEERFSEADASQKLAHLQTKKKRALAAIERQCTIAPIAHSELLSKESDVVATIKTATEIIGEFISEIVPVLSKDKEARESVVTELSSTESRLAAQKGRPNFVNYYTTAPDSVQRVSTQRVVGHAIPSTERQSAKLPNFVECGVGYMDDATYVSQFTGYRHSSYSAIKMEDKYQRRQADAAAAKEMIIELARQKIAQKPIHYSKDGTISLNLSSLALLSPIRGDKLLALTGESEYSQLKDSYNALMMYNGRSLSLEIDGKQYKVTPTINILNVPANPHGVFISGSKSSLVELETQINAQGMNQFIIKARKYITDPEYAPMKGSTRLLNLQQIIFGRKQKLVDMYEALEKIKDPQLYREQYDKIKNFSKEIFKIEVKLNNKYKKNRPNFVEKLKKVLEERERTQAALRAATNPDKQKELKKKIQDLEVAELVYQTILMQMDGKLEPNHYGARYLLASQKMGDSVDFYCKSGEDRTGRMQNFIEELCEFYRQYGHYPRYDVTTKQLNPEDVERQRKIAQYVSEFSVSRDINDQNAHGARGLQITSGMDINTGLPNSSGDAIGKMAKGVYTSALASLAKSTATVTVAQQTIIGKLKSALSMFNSVGQVKNAVGVGGATSKSPSSTDDESDSEAYDTIELIDDVQDQDDIDRDKPQIAAVESPDSSSTVNTSSFAEDVVDLTSPPSSVGRSGRPDAPIVQEETSSSSVPVLLDNEAALSKEKFEKLKTELKTAMQTLTTGTLSNLSKWCFVLGHTEKCAAIEKINEQINEQISKLQNATQESVKTIVADLGTLLDQLNGTTAEHRNYLGQTLASTEFQIKSNRAFKAIYEAQIKTLLEEVKPVLSSDSSPSKGA